MQNKLHASTSLMIIRIEKQIYDKSNHKTNKKTSVET